MKIYKTSEIAAIIGIHPNTVRLYEKWELIPKPERQPNGYRVFTDFHIEQFRLARLAFQIEILQNGLRKKIIKMVKISAAGDFDTALSIAEEYLIQVRQERSNAEESAVLVKQLLSGKSNKNTHLLKRKEVSDKLNITMDTLRNWEMNGLLTVSRKDNGYRVYTDNDIQRLKIIRSLRCANYSLESILHMLSQLSQNPDIDIMKALHAPTMDRDMASVCDQLTASLAAAENNAQNMIAMLKHMKANFKPSTMPPMF